MREILFRGKRLDNDELVDGNLFVSDTDGRTYILAGSRIVTIEWEVDPSTIGQYTGLVDKNGKRIFEGDMIDPFDGYGIDKMVVEFRGGQFLLCWYGEHGFMTEEGWEEKYGCFQEVLLSSYGDGLEIIGNIHDNPELLEEA